jgi:aminoglycoside N3'-acetyltransferase
MLTASVDAGAVSRAHVGVERHGGSGGTEELDEREGEVLMVLPGVDSPGRTYIHRSELRSMLFSNRRVDGDDGTDDRTHSSCLLLEKQPQQ